MVDKLEALQAENSQLVNSQSELLAEIGRLREQQIKLRERNLRLTQECHAKQQECSVLMEQLAQFARRRHSSEKGEFRDRKKQPSTVLEVQEDSDVGMQTVALKEYIQNVNRLEEIAFPEFPHGRTTSEPNLLKIQLELDRVRSGMGSPRRHYDVRRLDDSSDSSGSLDTDVYECMSGITAIRQEVQNQLLTLQNLSEFINTQQSIGFSAFFSSSSRDESAEERVCPVCRDTFPAVCKGDFETHVLNHFSDDIVKCVELLDLDI